MTKTKTMPPIALGAWAWGNDGTFGGNLTPEQLRPVFDAAMKAGLNLWDTAYAYSMGTSEKVLGELPFFCSPGQLSDFGQVYPPVRRPRRRKCGDFHVRNQRPASGN